MDGIEESVVYAAGLGPRPVAGNGGRGRITSPVIPIDSPGRARLAGPPNPRVVTEAHHER